MRQKPLIRIEGLIGRRKDITREVLDKTSEAYAELIHAQREHLRRNPQENEERQFRSGIPNR